MYYTPTTEKDFTDAYRRGERDFDLSGYGFALPAGLKGK